jgi:CBS domain-containing protein
MREGSRCFAVLGAGDFMGLITLTDIRRVPREEWASTSVYRAMTPASQLVSVSPAQSLMSVLQAMAAHDVNQLPVLHGRELVGMLDRGDVMRFIQVRRDLGGTAAARPPGAPPETAGLPGD